MIIQKPDNETHKSTERDRSNESLTFTEQSHGILLLDVLDHLPHLSPHLIKSTSLRSFLPSAAVKTVIRCLTGRMSVYLKMKYFTFITVFFICIMSCSSCFLSPSVFITIFLNMFQSFLCSADIRARVATTSSREIFIFLVSWLV